LFYVKKEFFGGFLGNWEGFEGDDDDDGMMGV